MVYQLGRDLETPGKDILDRGLPDSNLPPLKNVSFLGSVLLLAIKVPMAMLSTGILVNSFLS